LFLFFFFIRIFFNWNIVLFNVDVGHFDKEFYWPKNERILLSGNFF
jgi:hypothetical protein